MIVFTPAGGPVGAGGGGGVVYHMYDRVHVHCITGECTYVLLITCEKISMHTHSRLTCGEGVECITSDTHRQTKCGCSCYTDPVSTQARQTRDRVIGSRAADTFCIIM